jgi:hypothetical protein
MLARRLSVELCQSIQTQEKNHGKKEEAAGGGKTAQEIQVA